MNFRLRLQDDVDTIPMAPLIDIVFLTLVFFMATTTYSSLESELDITLPTASGAELSDRQQGEIYINVRADGSIILNEREVNLDELQSVLDRVAEYFPGGSVIIRGDR
ncbi:MAG: biopolymer transporter ExbD, partial [Candidatus Hydrogenedentota bacterium]